MDRGQLYTLEAVIAGMLLFMALLFVIQGIGVTPQSMGEQSTTEYRSLAEGTLRSMNETTLRTAVLYWNPTRGGSGTFHCSPSGSQYYPGYADNETCPGMNLTDRFPLIGNVSGNLTKRIPPNEFGQAMREKFGSGYSYNVYVAYNQSGTIERQRMVYQGQPGSGAAYVDRAVMLYNDSVVYNATGHPTSQTLSMINTSTTRTFYVPDAHQGSDLWNLVHVEVVVWGG